MARKPKQERAKATAQAIIEAGFISLKQHGLEGTTTKTIASIAGVGIGSVYEYFHDKEDIYRAMVQLFVDDSVQALQDIITDMLDLSIADIIKQLMYRFKDIFNENEQRYLQILHLQGAFDMQAYVKQTEAVLIDLAMQYMAKHPELLKVRHIRTTAYFLNNAVFLSSIRLISQTNTHTSFDELVEVVTNIITNHIQMELQQASVA